MNLSPGTRLGSYEVVARIGAGGMGEVYRARDMKLGREVAIKLVLESIVADAERAARFRREAQVLASLNHPNIATLFGMEEADGRHFLVMELVDGEDLSVRIARGAIPLADALPIATQITSALEDAHEHGIIHRDLKPANVKVRGDGTVKILDFGLAKALAADGASTSAEAVNSPTLTARATQMGMVLGTAAYMAPEQARAKAVDKRADIWAFGVVLYEMLTGRRAFEGDDVSITLASVLKDDVKWSALPADLPAPLLRLLHRCLEKDPKRRLSSIGDARLELEEAAAPTAPPAPVATVAMAQVQPQSVVLRVLPWAIAGTLALVCAGLLTIWRPRQPDRSSSLHLQMGLAPADAILGSDPNEVRVGSRRPSRTDITLSPDGRWLVFAGVQAGTQQLYLRELTRDQATPISGTQGGDNPFFSPDGRNIAFWANGLLKRVALDGGPVTDICKAIHVDGASWAPNDTIYFSAGGSVSKVSSSGGQPAAVTTLNRQAGERGHFLPWATPDGQHLIFTMALGRVLTQANIVVHSLATGERRVLMEGATDGRYVTSRHLVFIRRGTLMAVPFALDRLEVTGAPFGMVDNVLVSVNAPNSGIEIGAGQYAVSSAGHLVYLAGGMFADTASVLVWSDRQGRPTRVDMPPRAYHSPRLSPNGQQIVMGTVGMERELWMYDIGRANLSRLQFDGQAEYPLWSPDGKRVVFRGHAKDGLNLFWMPAGGGPAERLTTSPYVQTASAFTSDGRELIFLETRPTGTAILAMSMADRKIRETNITGTHPAPSPDGKWLAYASGDSGRSEVYLRALDGTEGRVKVSVNGGTGPRWMKDGKELLFLEPAGLDAQRIMSVAIALGPVPDLGTPRRLAELSTKDFGSSTPLASYDIAADGRLLSVTRDERTPPPPTTLTVIVNWFEELRAKAPGR